MGCVTRHLKWEGQSLGLCVIALRVSRLPVDGVGTKLNRRPPSWWGELVIWGNPSNQSLKRPV